MYPSARPLSRALGIACAGGLAGLLWGWLGGVANFDAAFALAWAQGAGGGSGPGYASALAPTPHPLQTLLALGLAPLGHQAEPALVGVALGAYGAAVWLAWQIARAWSGAAAGWIAAAAVATAPGLVAAAGRGYVDVAALALVLGAVLVETRRRRAGLPVVALLAAAGLARPEAWLLSAAYLAWLAPALPARRLAGLAALAAAAPAAWALGDLLVAGNPLHSLLATRAAAAEFGRPRGLAGLAAIPAGVAAALGLPAALAAAGGGALLGRRGTAARTGVPALAAALAAAALLAMAGLPMDSRYLLVPAVLLAILGAAGLGDAVAASRGRAAAAVLVALLAVAIPLRAERLAGIRASVAATAAARAAVRAAAGCTTVVLREAAVIAAAARPADGCVRLSAGAPRRSPTASRR